MTTRVVVSGIGLVTPVGSSLEEFRRAIYSGKPGIREIQDFDTSRCETKVGGTVTEFNPHSVLTNKEIFRLDKGTQMAVVAGAAALRDSRLLDNGAIEDASELGTVIGTGTGSAHSVEQSYCAFFTQRRIDPFSIPMGMHHAAASYLSIKFGLRGCGLTVSTACSSGAVALGAAFHEIKSGRSCRMLAGGVDASLTRTHLEIWGSMRVLSSQNEHPERCMKPFSRNRDGFVIGEGAVMLVLEELESARGRGAPIYGEVVGYGCSSDASHITAPSVDGPIMAMTRALRSAEIGAESVDYINAHGTATYLNDKTETEAIKRTFPQRSVPVSSIKPITGHMFGASSAAEFVAILLACQLGEIPPTVNYEQEDPECDLDYVVTGPRKTSVRYALSNSFAFGGHNAVLVAKHVE